MQRRVAQREMLPGHRFINGGRFNAREMQFIEIRGLPEIGRAGPHIVDHVAVAALEDRHRRVQVGSEIGIQPRFVTGGALRFEVRISLVGRV